MGVGLGTGLDAQIGVGEEKTGWGTIATIDHFFEFLSESISDNRQALSTPGLLGRGAFNRSDRTITYPQATTGTTTHFVPNKGMELLWYLMFGQEVLTWPGSTNASQVLTFTGQPTAAQTVTIGATVYTARASVATTAYEFLIGTTTAETIRNLAYAINRGPGAGTYYGSLTPAHPSVIATYNATTLTVTDKTGTGATANTVATTETLANATFGAATLAGGVNGTDAARLFTYTLPDRLTYDRSGTIQVNRPSRDGIDHAFTYAGAKVSAWKLSVGLDGWVQLEVTWTTKPGVTATALATATYPSGSSLYDFTQSLVTVGGTTINIQSFELTGTWAVQTDTRNLSNTQREQLANGTWQISGSMDAEFENLTAYTAFLASTHQAIVATFTGGTIPSSASPFKLTITLADTMYTGTTPQVGGPDVIQQPLTFDAYNDGTNPVMKLEYQTSDTAR